MLSKMYRCWAVYGHSWRVVWLPIMLWLGSLTCAVLAARWDFLSAVEATQDPEAASRQSLFYDPITAFYSINIATNLFSTGMTTLFCFVI
jgi:hypothetical protein